MNSDAKNIAQSWSIDLMDSIEKRYIERKQRASGQFGDSLEDVIKVYPSRINIQILSAPQIGIMQTGRIPNKNQDDKKIKAWVRWAGRTFLTQWVKNKKIDANPYAVAWKIARKGITVPNDNNDGNLLNETITNEKIEQLISELGENLLVDIQSKYIKQWQ